MSQDSTGTTVMVDGRIVWQVAKTLFEGRPKTDQNTKQPRYNKAGEPMIEYGFGLSIQKSVLTQCAQGQPGEVWMAMHAEAFKLFPSAAATGQVPPSFAMKYKDGDGLDDKGIPFAQREGYAGNIVLACTTTIPIKWFRFENGQNFLVNEGIKCGDYVRVQLNIKSHPAHGAGKAGLYLNPMAVQFIGHGKEIINTPSGDQIFGTAMPPLPAGASATPLAPQPGQMLVPQYPQGFPAPPGGMAPPMPGYAPPPPVYQPPAPTPQPHFGVLPPVHQPPAGGMPMGYPQPGNVPMPVGYPAPGAPAIPSGVPMPPSFAGPAASQGMPAWPGAPSYPTGR